MKLVRRIRLSTLLLLVVVLAITIDLYLVRRRQAQTLAALTLYRQPRTEGIYDVLDQPAVTTYPDGGTLEDVLKDIKRCATRALKLPSGVPIYVDPIGLQEAERSMLSKVKRPESADQLPLKEHLNRVLEPLGLGFSVKEGYLMITSKESLDLPVGDEVDPYVKFRDVLQ
jgi:hypothetical protein